MNELKRKLALWLCPELEEELKMCAEAHDNAQKAMISLRKRLSDTELELTKARLQRNRSNWQAREAEDKSKAVAKQLEQLEKEHKALVRRHLIIKGLYEKAHIQSSTKPTLENQG